MSDKMQKKEIQKELDEIQKQMIEEAKLVRKDFEKTPSDKNVTDVNIDFDSPYLDENLTGEQWKQVIKPQYMDKFNAWLEQEKKKKK